MTGRRNTLRLAAALGLVLGASWLPTSQAAEAASMDDLFEDAPKPAAPAPAAPARPATAQAPAVKPAKPATEDATSVEDLFEPAAPAPAAAKAPAATAPPGEAPPAAPPPPAAVAAAAAPVARAPAVKITGLYDSKFAYTVANPDHYSKLRQLFKLRLNGQLSSRVKWQLGGHFEYDPVYEFENHYSKKVADDQKVFGYMDESYLDIDADSWEFRLGRQHIIWGEMVGLFFADVISPLDLREFVLPSFDLMRIPQWAARAEYFNGNFHGEFVYIPVMTIDNIGVFGSDFFPYPVSLPAGVQAQFLRDKAPEGHLGDDYAVGARASYLVSGWDLSTFYYTSPDKTAALSRTISLLPVPTVTFKPVHDRIHQFGSTLAKDFGTFVLKAEAIETLGRQMSVTRLSDADGLTQTDEFRYVVGIDWAGETGHNVNLQFFQTWLQNHDPAMLFKEIETGFSVMLTTTSWHPNLTPEVLWIRSLDRDEWLLETKLTWKFAPDWRATLGADVFAGPPTGLFGQFDHKDRVYTEFRHEF